MPSPGLRPLAGTVVALIGVALVLAFVPGATTGALSLWTGLEQRGVAEPGAAPAAAAPIDPRDRSRAARLDRVGIFSPDRPIVLANLTVDPGRYRITGEFTAQIRSRMPVSLSCGIVDANGFDRFIEGESTTIMAGDRSQSYRVSLTLSIGDTTLGLRCAPSRPGALYAEFEQVELSTTPVARR